MQSEKGTKRVAPRGVDNVGRRQASPRKNKDMFKPQRLGLAALISYSFPKISHPTGESSGVWAQTGRCLSSGVTRTSVPLSVAFDATSPSQKLRSPLSAPALLDSYQSSLQCLMLSFVQLYFYCQNQVRHNATFPSPALPAPHYSL